MADAVNLSDKAIKELVKLGQSLGSMITVQNGTPYAVVPEGSRIEDLSKFIFNEHAKAPARVRNVVQVPDVASFKDYWTLFHDENSRAFANETNNSVTAILDYHGAGEGSPRWGSHKLTLALETSEEWKTWTKKNGQQMTQEEFAEFLEDNAPDVTNPTAATMLEIARTFQYSSDVQFKRGVRLATGQVQLDYHEMVNGVAGENGQIQIPERFTVSIPVFIRAERRSMEARLRYRVANGKLAIWYSLWRPDEVRREAFRATILDIRQHCGENALVFGQVQ